MLRASLWTALLCAVLLSTVHGSPGFAQGSYLGIFADSLGTTPCAALSPPAGTTLYLIAKIDTAAVSGITGAEYRIEVSHPEGWYFTYNPLPGGTSFGNPLDTWPETSDSSGLLVAFGECRAPVGNRVALGTLTVMNFGQGGRTELRVRRHSLPSNPTFQCPLFMLCDFEKACMWPSTEASCSYSKPSAIADIGPQDPIKFVFVLDVAPGTEGPFPGLVSKPAIVDMVGNKEGYSNPSTILPDSTLGFWDFEGGSDCNPMSWEGDDNREVDFGEWGRLYQHITDNDECTENTTCAWLWSDDTTPWLSNDPSMSFGPDGFVVHYWLDNTIISPWVSLSGLPLGETVLSFREFPGNVFPWSRIMRGVSARGRNSSGDVSDWQDGAWADLGTFTWVTRIEDISTLLDRDWTSLQVRFRVTDQQLFGWDRPIPYIPGPGPFLEDVRIGRTIHEAPIMVAGKGDTRWQAQDAFPSSSMPPFAPITSGEMARFGTCAFSMSKDLGGIGSSVIRGDSIAVEVKDAGHGAIDTVRCFFSIVAGVHAGKVPPGATQTAGGLCEWPVTHVGDKWFVDPPDSYFRGGDVVHYFWWAIDGNINPGVSSLPKGVTEDLIETYTLAQAEAATGGLYEVSFLPTIAWDSTYVARVQADPEGDVEPDSTELANSAQKNCILYVNKVNTERRTSDAHRTSFMYTLDRLGYRDESGVRKYDVYDLQGWGDTNNDLGSRAVPLQAQGYSLIVHDAGRSKFWPIPDGSDPMSARVDQASWYQTWLANAGVGAAGQATLWVIGENVAE